VYTPVERAALALVDALTATPARVDDALYAELRRHFDERQLVELASAIAWENYRARFNRVFEVEAEGFSAGAYCPLPLPPAR
jgi:alkylhydroperoxidase family enzyme